MDREIADNIIRSYIESFNSKNYDIFSNFCIPALKYQSYQKGKVEWERNGIDSLNDHAKNIILKIAPDWHMGEVQNSIFNESEIWFMVNSTGTITGKADFGDYLDSNREPTFEKFIAPMTIIFVIENAKVSIIKHYIDTLDIFLKMRIVKFVEDSDNIDEYIRMIYSEGLTEEP